MKKVFILSIGMLLAFTMVGCKQDIKVDSVITDIGESSKFSQKEIKQAIINVKDNFDFKGCTLKRLLYDEEKSAYATKGYLENGRASINGVEAENVIVLFSEFDVDSAGGDGSFNPNSTYDNFQFILIRDNKTSDWKIDDRGY